jgi:P27 family predicted phage terminase small subunit
VSKQRAQKSTISNLVSSIQELRTLPEPPLPLNEAEKAVFDRLMKSREVSTWSEHDLQLAANLAQTQVQFQECMAAVKRDGRTTVNERGTPVANPEVAALNQLGSAVRALTAQLGLSASQRGVSGNNQKTRDAHERDLREAWEKSARNSLLA